MKHLTDRVAVVTGAASGIGLAMARRFSAAGMKLAMADIDAEALAGVAATFRGGGAGGGGGGQRVVARRRGKAAWGCSGFPGGIGGRGGARMAPFRCRTGKEMVKPAGRRQASGDIHHIQ